MTTVAYKNREIAADSRITAKNFIFPGEFQKLERLSNGAVMAVAGLAAEIERAREALHENPDTPDMPRLKEAEVVMVRPNGTVWTYAGMGPWLEHPGPYGAWGSGADYAYGALAAGASASEAVEVGKLFDAYSGGTVQVLRIEERK